MKYKYLWLITVVFFMLAIPLSHATACTNNWAGGKCTGDITYTTGTTLTSDVNTTGIITINTGITLLTNGFSIINASELNFTSGIITAGWSTGESGGGGGGFGSSYGGSGGGAANGWYNGGGTLAPGGTAGAGCPCPNDGNPGSTPTPPTVTSTLIESWYSGTISNYLSGGGGGASAALGGHGSYGIFIKATTINAGVINTFGGNGHGAPEVSGAGAGGGGVILLWYTTLVNGTYNFLGGLGGVGSGGSHGGYGGDGQILQLQVTSSTVTTTTSTSVTTTTSTSVTTTTIPPYAPGNSSWVVPNYQDYTNISVNFCNTMLFSKNIGCVGWLYLNTTYNTTLWNDIVPPTIEGYNGNVFVGNVIAYPYINGYLIKNTTILGNPYNKLVIFFNWISGTTPSAFSTYLDTLWSTKPYVKTYSNGNIGGNLQVQVYNVSINAITNVNSQLTIKNQNSQNLAGSLNLNFNLGTPYYLIYNGIITNISQTNNFSMAYNEKIIGGLSNFKSNYSLNNANETLTSWGVIGSNNVTNNSFVDYLFLYLTEENIKFTTSNLYYNFLSKDMGLKSNATIFNSTTIKPQFSSIFYQNDEYILNFKYKNITNTQLYPNLKYDLVPAYTTNYTVLITNKITNASYLNYYLNTSCPIDTIRGWYNDFNYRQLINVTNWNYSFLSYAYASQQNNIHIGNPYTKNIINSKYLMLNTTRYTVMGNNCQFVYFRAYNNQTDVDLGSIPYAINYCAGNKASFILHNRTNQNNIYNNFYMYIGSRNNISGYNNQIILTDFRQSYIAPQTSLNIPINSYTIHFSNGLNPSTKISMAWVSGRFLNLSGRSNGLPYTNIGGYFFSNSSNFNKTFIILANKPYSSGGLLNDIIGNGVFGEWVFFGGGDFWSTANASALHTQSGGTSVVSLSNITLWASNTNVTFTTLYASKYIIHTAEKYPCAITNINNSFPIHILPVSNGSIVGGNNNQSIFGNHTAFILGLKGSSLFLGISTPNYIIYVLEILLIVAIGFSFALTNEYVQFILLLGLWAVGLMNLFVSQGISLTIIAILITLIYVVRNAHKWF